MATPPKTTGVAFGSLRTLNLVFAFTVALAGASCSTSSDVQPPAIAIAPAGFIATVDSASGEYSVAASVAPAAGVDSGSAVDATSNSIAHAWTFAGHFDSPLTAVSNSTGADRVGPFHEVSFNVTENGVPLTGAVRTYDGGAIALFSLTYGAPAETPAAAFPDFTTIPKSLYPFSYKTLPFAPPAFHAVQDGSPRLLFNDSKNAAVISPADHFLINILTGDGKTRVASALRPKLRDIPAGFTQKTLLALGRGINPTLDLWGRALTDLENKDRTVSDADASNKYLGYWTDSGSAHYYKFDAKKGCAGTLLSVAKHFEKSQIPVRYMQLDSWLYPKSMNGPDGGSVKNKSAKFPDADWNRGGGLIEYGTSPLLFPGGLADFRRQVGLPLIVENRWIDPASPYWQKYKISGFAVVDSAYWSDLAGYLKNCGAICYEQDSLNEIFRHSPELASTPDLADAFFDGMANACRDSGLFVQYSMALPCEFLQGSRYSNLTSIRCGNERFNRDRWRDFLFTSRLASALGIRPCSGGCLSSDIDSLLLSTLSAGSVGFGDEAGMENPGNLLQAVRADGVIVKPDAAIVPLDDNYLTIAAPLAAAANRPLITGRAYPMPPAAPIVSGTFTDHGGHRTGYVFAFNDPHGTLNATHFSPAADQDSATSGAFHFSPAADFGIRGSAVVYEYFTGKATPIADGATCNGTLDGDNAYYAEVAPIGASGIAFLGDADKFVSTGKQRIAAIEDRANQLTVAVTLAQNETAVLLHGIAKAPPMVAVANGSAGPVNYDAANGHFVVEIKASPDAPMDETDGDPVRTVGVTFRTK